MKTTEQMAGAKVETFRLVAANGRPIRKATKVVLADGREIRFVEKMTKGEALRNVQYQIDQGNFGSK